MLFLEAGIEVAASDKDGKTPLLYALEDCRDYDSTYALVETYLSKGANTEIVNRAGRTPLFYTMNGVHFAEKIAGLLLKYGANLNHRDLDGETLLLYAVRRRREKAVEFFLRSGANTGIKDDTGRGVIEVAALPNVWGLGHFRLKRDYIYACFYQIRVEKTGVCKRW